MAAELERLARQFKESGYRLAGELLEDTVQSWKAANIIPDRLPGRREVRERFDLQVKGLREEGLSNSQIVNQLDVPEWRVEEASQRLLAQGETRRRRAFIYDYSEIDLKIKELRDRGVPNDEIREQLGLNRSQYSSRIQKLLYQGEIKRYQGDTRRGARFDFSRILDRYTTENPGKPIVFKEIAERLGVSRERVRQLYHQIAAEREVPPVKSRDISEKQEDFDEKVKALLAAGLGLSEIAQELCVTNKLVREAKPRIHRRFLKEREAQISELKGRGLGDKEISKITGLSRGVVSTTLQRLYKKEEAQRVRKEYRNKEEVEQFKEKLVQLRLDPRNLTNRQIAEITGERAGTIMTYTSKLIAEGRIAKRPRGKKTPSSSL